MRMLKGRVLLDNIFRKSVCLITVLAGLVVFGLMAGLFLRSQPVLGIQPLHKILFSSEWHPLQGKFGLLSFLAGTLWVTLLSVGMAVPVCLLTSIYLAEYAPGFIQRFSANLIDLLAGIPSIVYGIWGILIIVPLIKDFVAPYLGVTTSGYCVLTGAVVLSIMISPMIIQISTEIMRGVPVELKEASLALGASHWETVKHVILRKAAPGIAASIILGISRAFGETMAVIMVVGNVAQVPGSLFDAGYPLPALIANNYGEMLSVPRYDAAIMFAAFFLMAVILFFNISARLILKKIKWQAS